MSSIKRRHLGEKNDKEIKLKIKIIIAKAASKFGSEVWMLQKRDEQRQEAPQMKF